MDAQLDGIVVEPAGTHEATILWLHGLGADGADFLPMVDALGLPPGHGVRFIFPHAPERPITVNRGWVMRGWYDVRGNDLTVGEDAEGIESSARAVRALLAKEIAAGIAPAAVLLAGFSQGGAITLHAGLRADPPIGGLVALSTYLPLPDRLGAEVNSGALAATPVFMGHGRWDTIITLAQGSRSRERLAAAGVNVEWREYPMAHSVSPEEVSDLASFIRRRLAAAGVRV